MIIIVRERAKNIIELLNDEEKLQNERDNAKKLRDKLSSQHFLNFVINSWQILEIRPLAMKAMKEDQVELNMKAIAHLP